MSKAEMVNRSWVTLNHPENGVMSLDEKSLKKILDQEIAGKFRVNHVKRIHARYSKLRAERELSEILKKGKSKPTKKRKS